MKAFFHRLHIGGGGTKEKDRDLPKLPPLRSWPPPEEQSQAGPTGISSSASYSSFKPLPELVPAEISSQLNLSHGSKDVSRESSSSSGAPTLPSYSSPKAQSQKLDLDRSQSPRQEASDATARGSRKQANGSLFTSTAAASVTNSEIQKKVAFISPSTTPTPSNIDNLNRSTSPSGAPPPMKTTLSRFQAAHGKEPTQQPRGSTSSSAGASSSKTDLTKAAPVSGKATSMSAASNRTGSPYLHKTEASAQSLRSGTPYSQMSNNTSGSRILAAQSWSEVTEEDLVSNIGSRERTRQEVLFEIISSEERYVQELVKMKDTFIDPLLHPFSASTSNSPLSSTPNLDYDYFRSESPSAESADHLPPIAARFMSPTPTKTDGASTPRSKHPMIDGESMDSDDDELEDNLGRAYISGRAQGATSQASKMNHPRSPYRATMTRNLPGGKNVPFPSRSHHSLPPPPRKDIGPSGSTHSLGRTSTMVERERNYSQGQASLVAERNKHPQPKSGMLRKAKKSEVGPSPLGDTIAPHQLPDDLRICLEVIDSGVFDGHKRLCEALKKRYDDQYPLVRSLADVFVSNADIFQGYATYVLHLERALEQVDGALSNVSTKKPKKQDVAEWQKVCKFLQKLEENASEKGETGLAITLSKPFQRLLKYPLLFQNLLFHTDPSTFEYESTLQMVAEVENIVRSIEDEKIQKEERDKTRDVFARIEGLDKVRQLALPKPSRILVEERQCAPPAASSGLKSATPPPAMANGKNGVKGKSSFKRLSDVLSPGGGKKDLWFVVFNDVVLQCQKTGTTSLPLVAATNSRSTSMPELQGRSKYATTGRRNSHTRPRNMYKFIKIETWAIGDVAQPREGVVSMEDVARSRAQVVQPRIVPLPDDREDEEDAESDDSDRKSKMSFSYWGADKVTVQKPVIKTARLGVPPRRGGGQHGASYGRESSANAKFGTRLVSSDASAPRPASRRTAATPTSRRPDELPNFAKATVTRPEWNTSTRPPIAVAGTKRARNLSQTSGAAIAAASVRSPNAKGLASPAPSNISEDSGVGLYRQMLANDPSLNQV
ncbi:hypothetical protein C8J56DRAFT_236077 [Mycena floridula]|nr:hypothetical protein C8J56DRAFT_236077 [Mycena floridula]